MSSKIARLLVNRILFPDLNEAMVLFCRKGAGPRAIDAAATAFACDGADPRMSEVVGLDTFSTQASREAAFADRAAHHSFLGLWSTPAASAEVGRPVFTFMRKVTRR